jgi:hypothetical protein
MKPILLIFLFSLSLNFGFSQCADSVYYNNKCFNLFWSNARPTPYPATIIEGGFSYSLDPVGSTAKPSNYKYNNGSCGNNDFVPFRGTVTIAGQPCFYNSSGILPIDILSLKATRNGRNLKVDFNIDNDEPDVIISLSASTDGEEWTTLPWSKIINTEDYKFIYSLDKQLSVLENYEYIKVQGIKLDGRVSFSKVISIDKTESKAFDIYPNPSQNGIYNLMCASCSDKNAVIEVYSPEGKRISSNTASNSVYTIDLSKSTNGVYIVKVIQDGETVTKRVVKMN